ncbi:MAG: long-chain fatty acid--CoA ligase [Vicinamibacteria bacterium]|nr:long-chain fatty acid--CoA ligase [Vicinamibacteria bacterium]
MTVNTLCDIFFRSVETFRKPEHLRFKQDGAWRAISSAEYLAAVEELSMGLRGLGLEPGERVAILSENRPEWMFADLAVLCAAAADAPIYPSLTPSQVAYILKDCGARICFVSTPVQAAKVEAARAEVPALVHVIRFDESPAIPGTLSLSEVRARGREALAAAPKAVRERAATVKPSDLATLIYTSGTTGDPKGVMLVHSNLVSNVLASASCVEGIGPDDHTLSFLPLCHSFERMAGHYWMLHQGATINFAESVEKVPDNLLEIRPTIMTSVPRLYEKIHARVQEAVASAPPLRQKLFRWALGVGGEVFQLKVARQSPGPLLGLKLALADKLVLAKIRGRVGGRVKYFVSGGAPLGQEVAEFFGAAGMLILEGYGLTETSPVICVNRPGHFRPGTVGPALPGVEVKIAADGEILTRGPHVMRGYFNKPEATAEAIDPEGWFHTGDIGVLEADGFLRITDRKKDLIVTSGGKNIAPQPIENRIKAHPLFAEVVMIGDKRNFAVALVVPNLVNLEKWAQERGLAVASREELIARPEVVALYEGLVAERTTDLAQFEKIKKIALIATEFTIEAGELTPTLKVKRRVVERKYKDLIDRMYAGGAA